MAKVKVSLINSKNIRRETSRLASIANKRIQRLENADLKSSPAYQKWIDEGGQKFGVKGKDYNQVQAELARLRQFLDAKTSTIRGINSTLREMAHNTGVQYKDIADLRGKAENFFNLASKVEQYLRTVEDIASAIGYQKIWEAINVYVKESGTDLGGAGVDIDRLTGIVSDIITKGNNKELVIFKGGNSGGEIWGVIK